MTDKDKSAFPIYQPDTLVTEETFYKATDTGMTLRDFFAAAALTGLAVQRDFKGGWPTNISAEGLMGIAASQAYGLADAMLAAREENK
jgi:hypothetical protein